MNQFVNEALIKYNIMNEINFLSNKIMHSELSNDEFFKTLSKIKNLKTMLC